MKSILGAFATPPTMRTKFLDVAGIGLLLNVVTSCKTTTSNTTVATRDRFAAKGSA